MLRQLLQDCPHKIYWFAPVSTQWLAAFLLTFQCCSGISLQLARCQLTHLHTLDTFYEVVVSHTLASTWNFILPHRQWFQIFFTLLTFSLIVHQKIMCVNIMGMMLPVLLSKILQPYLPGSYILQVYTSLDIGQTYLVSLNSNILYVFLTLSFTILRSIVQVKDSQFFSYMFILYMNNLKTLLTT